MLKGQNRTVLCLYPQNPAHLKQVTVTPQHLAGSLLKQLIQCNPTRSISNDVREVYEARRRGEVLDEGALCRILAAEIATYDRVYLVIDALDAYSEGSLGWLTNDVMSLVPEKLSIMASSRDPDVDKAIDIRCDICEMSNVNIYFRCKICEDFDICRACEAQGKRCDKDHELEQPSEVYFEVWTSLDEIERYVKFELAKKSENGKPLHWDTRKHTIPPNSTRLGNLIRNEPELESLIPVAVANKADGNFGLAKVYVDSLANELTSYGLKQAVQNLPDGLYAHYKRDIEQVMIQKHKPRGRLALKILYIVALARRNLSFVELQHALVLILEPKSSAFEDSKVFERKDILKMTRQLITIDCDEGAAVTFSHPTLSHQTLQAYVDEYQDQSPTDVVVEAKLAQACLTYLSFEAVSRPCETLLSFEARRRNFPLIAYASQHWGDHVRLASDAETDAMAVDFLKSPHRVAAYLQAAWLTSTSEDVPWNSDQSISALHICAWLGLTSVILALGHGVLNVDLREPMDHKTPLMYACRRGHLDVVRQLLTLGASINASSLRGTTPIFEAVAGNHEEIFKLLRSRRELQINTRNLGQFDRTALMVVVSLQRLDMVQDLLRTQGVDINIQDVNGSTALSIAVAQGDSTIIQLILEQEAVDVNLFSYTQGLSALGIAASKNDCITVRLLLDHGADPGHRDNYAGGSAIYRAVQCGSILAVKMMVEHHTKFGVVDDDGRNLAHWASAEGHLDIIHVLHNEGFQMNHQDKYGSTPLHEAIRHGKIEAIHALLQSRIDPSIKDNDHKSAIDVAWQYGEAEAVSLLTSKDPSKEGRTMNFADETRPIWALAKTGRLDLIERAKTAGIMDFTQRETRTNMNALHFATLYGHADILKFLLQNGTIPVNDSNHHQHTPLHMAAISNNVNATSAILSKGGAELDCRDRWGDTPLSIATNRMHLHVAVLLVEGHADLDAKFVDRSLQALFFEAIELNNVGAVRVLIDKGVDVLGRNETGEMALQVALREKYGEMERVLRESSSFFRSVSEDNGAKRKNDGEVEYTASPRQKPRIEH